MDMGFETRMFNHTVAGDKDIEGRLRWKKFLNVKVGDVISLREDLYDENHQEVDTVARHVAVCVKEVIDYPGFRQMLEELGFRRAIPDAETIEDAVAVYHRFYAPEQEAAYGVRAIVFELAQPQQGFSVYPENL